MHRHDELSLRLKHVLSTVEGARDFNHPRKGYQTKQPMRKRIIGAVVLALSGVLVLAVLNVNFLVRRNKDYLIGRLEQALGRKITVDKIEVTLSPGRRSFGEFCHGRRSGLFRRRFSAR